MIRTVTTVSVLAFWLLLSAPDARADIIYSNFGPGHTYQPGGYSVSGAGMTVLPPKGFGSAVAFSFTPTDSFLFGSVELPLVATTGSTNSFIVALMSDAGGHPGTILESFPLTNAPSNNSPAIDSFISTTHTPLDAATTYWIVAMPNSPDTAGFWLANSTGAIGYSRTANDSLTWIPQPGASPALEVDGLRAVPEPSTLALFAVSIAGLAAVRWVEPRERAGGKRHHENLSKLFRDAVGKHYDHRPAWQP